MTNYRRRDLLAGTALVVLGGPFGRASTLPGSLPWTPGAGSPPTPAAPGPWEFFTTAEAAAVETIADHVIPPDAETPGGKDAGCAVFIDRQLAGPYGASEGLYDRAPFIAGTKSQGPQSALTPRQMYRAALVGLEQYCRAHEHMAWRDLPADKQDAVLRAVESGQVPIDGFDSKTFFTLLLKDMQEGFFADPVYGGNRDMCAWKMIGFPGAHYDYRDWVERHNERYPHPPVSIAGRPGWNVKKS